jgi:hypothetical protein
LNCKICGNNSSIIFKRQILLKYEIEYYQCNACGFIQTEEPYWLPEAYQNAINVEDTGIAQRNILSAKRTSALICFLFEKSGRFVDWGGGSGLFVRLMRDYGFDFYWNDPYADNIFARGFEHDRSKNLTIELVTAFECFEHFADPLQEIERMLSLSRSLIFSTVPFRSGTPNPDTWDYYGFIHGQHIAFYSLDSLRALAKKYELNFYSNEKSFHLLTYKRLNQTMYNFLLKLSLFGIPAITSLLLGSKTESDIHITKQKRTIG